MGGSAKSVVSAVSKITDPITSVVGVKLTPDQQPQGQQQEVTQESAPQGTAQTVSAQGGAQQAQQAGAGEDAAVSRGSGARNTDPRRARAKFRTPTVSVGGTNPVAKPGTSIGI